jgi:hypothetical protein
MYTSRNARTLFSLLAGLPVFAAALLPVSDAQTPPERFPAEEGYVTVRDGVRLFYRKIGAGHDVVVFLHGGPGLSMGDGGYAMRPLAEQHTLILYDQRGSGRSDLIKDPKLLTATALLRSTRRRIQNPFPELSSSIRCRLR